MILVLALRTSNARLFSIGGLRKSLGTVFTTEDAVLKFACATVFTVCIALRHLARITAFTGSTIGSTDKTCGTLMASWYSSILVGATRTTLTLVTIELETHSTRVTFIVTTIDRFRNALGTDGCTLCLFDM